MSNSLKYGIAAVFALVIAGQLYNAAQPSSDVQEINEFARQAERDRLEYYRLTCEGPSQMNCEDYKQLKEKLEAE